MAQPQQKVAAVIQSLMLEYFTEETNQSGHFFSILLVISLHKSENKSFMASLSLFMFAENTEWWSETGKVGDIF